jgi:adenine phosphoribosyltransferase
MRMIVGQVSADMNELKQYIASVPDFPKPGILFRDIAPLLRSQFGATIQALEQLFTDAEWQQFDAVAGIESRGFILAAALAAQRGKGFVPIRKRGKLPPPVVAVAYALEYGTDMLEMQPGVGNLLLVDDVIATGGTFKAASSACVEAGYSVVGLAALIDLKLVPDFTWRNVQLRSAMAYD